ncbi:hypothetical protein EC919_109263 [Pseudomonas graminis]|nr:hypothetical protein EC919_109263 [Pseudomonas graminis]
MGFIPAVAAGGRIYPIEFCRLMPAFESKLPAGPAARGRSAVEWRPTVGATGVALHLAREWGQPDEIHFVARSPSRASALLQVLHRSTFRGQALKLWRAACWRRRWASRHPFHRHTAIAGKRAPTGFASVDISGSGTEALAGSVLANALGQTKTISQTDRLRGQARSYRFCLSKNFGVRH